MRTLPVGIPVVALAGWLAAGACSVADLRFDLDAGAHGGSATSSSTMASVSASSGAGGGNTTSASSSSASSAASSSSGYTCPGTCPAECYACDLVYHAGICTALPYGEACGPGTDQVMACGPTGCAASGSGVVGASCAMSATCLSGLSCTNGACRLALGSVCSDDLECASALCDKSTGLCAGCTTDQDCASKICQVQAQVCRLPNGAPCIQSSSCASNACLNGFCGVNTGATCQVGGSPGCITGYCAGNLCAECTQGNQCLSHACQTVALPPGPGTCLFESGAYCKVNQDCASGHCDPAPIISKCQ